MTQRRPNPGQPEPWKDRYLKCESSHIVQLVDHCSAESCLPPQRIWQNRHEWDNCRSRCKAMSTKAQTRPGRRDCLALATHEGNAQQVLLPVATWPPPPTRSAYVRIYTAESNEKDKTLCPATGRPQAPNLGAMQTSSGLRSRPQASESPQLGQHCPNLGRTRAKLDDSDPSLAALPASSTYGRAGPPPARAEIHKYPENLPLVFCCDIACPSKHHRIRLNSRHTSSFEPRPFAPNGDNRHLTDISSMRVVASRSQSPVGTRSTFSRP